MTTYSKRRGRRSLAAILAAMLMASVLAVVAGSPVHAANTSAEYLVDHDDDASTAKVREFAGRDRYDTALRLAKRFANDQGGYRGVDTVFVASGESLVDSVSVAGYAGYLDAPVLLTSSMSLHSGVADYIEDYGIDTVHVLGGIAAVSDDVISEIEDLVGSPTVKRISGADRYATSAAIAELMTGEHWCGTNDDSAIVASGANDMLFDAVAIGPVANRLELPVLLTDGNMLVDTVTTFVSEHDIEHAVVVGSTASVSDSVIAELRAAGVDTVQRISGNSPAEISVAVAEVINDECASALSPVSYNTVALVNSDNVIDGITAAPTLSDNNDELGGGLIPILAVGSELPTAVRDYLASTPEELGDGRKVHMRILAIGGTSAVSAAVMDAAEEAAATADALTVQISADAVKADAGLAGINADAANKSMIYLHFSDDVNDEDTRNRLEDLVYVNGIPEDIASASPNTVKCQSKVVPVTFEGRVLKPGDKVEVRSGSVLVGAKQDLRPIQPAEETVPAPVPDTERPQVELVAITGHDMVYALVSDNKGLDQDRAGTLLDDGNRNVDVHMKRTRGGGGFGTTVDETDSDETASRSDGKTVLSFVLTDDVNTPPLPNSPADDESKIQRGDQFRVNRDAIFDTAKKPNANEVEVASAESPVEKLRVDQVLMSDLDHERQASANVPIPGIPLSGDRTTSSQMVRLTAKKGEAAQGAYGNDWQVRADRAKTWDKNKPVDIAVFISTKDQRIVVRIVDGEPTLGDLKNELEREPTVNRLFSVDVNDVDDICVPYNQKLNTDNLPVVGDGDTGGDDTRPFAGGATEARIEVTFNGWVEDISDTESATLAGHVLEATLKRAKAAREGATAWTLAELLQEMHTFSVDENQQLVDDPAPTGDVFAHDGSELGPIKTVGMDFGVDDATLLPLMRIGSQRGDHVLIPEGFARVTSADTAALGAGFKVGDIKDTDDDKSTGIVPSPKDPEASVANGYGDVGDAENDYNWGSSDEIRNSSRVKYPK